MKGKKWQGRNKPQTVLSIPIRDGVHGKEGYERDSKELRITYN
jgi:hypothetical protein